MERELYKCLLLLSPLNSFFLCLLSSSISNSSNSRTHLAFSVLTVEEEGARLLLEGTDKLR